MRETRGEEKRREERRREEKREEERRGGRGLSRAAQDVVVHRRRFHVLETVSASIDFTKERERETEVE